VEGLFSLDPFACMFVLSFLSCFILKVSVKIGGLGLFDSSRCLVLCYFSLVGLAFRFSMDKLVA
jgi:hypothetical protein